jgi:hypothetical protein
LPAVLAVVCSLSIPLAAWGRKGHEITASLAFRDLPPELGPWFQGQEAILLDHCNDPDEWRQGDAQEAPRHFLHAEAYGGPAGVPRDIQEAEARLGPEAFEQNGQVPWIIQQRVERLAKAFRAGDPARAALESAILCHYVGDLNVPLHTTANYNGQLTGQHGVHARWETGLVERLGSWDPEPRPATPGEAAWFAPFQWLQESYALVAPLLRDDAASTEPSLAQSSQWNAQISHYWTEFRRRQTPCVKEQLERAGHRTAEMILLAWTLAGQPELTRAVLQAG